MSTERTSMSHILVRLADFAVDNNLSDTLFVYGIGSTLAVILYDDAAKVGGMLHFMFPSSASGSINKNDYSCMYADRGIPQLVNSCVELGANRTELSGKLAGGAFMLGKGVAQSISDGNISVARSILSKLGIKVVAENTGGHFTRTVMLDIATGETSVKRSDSNWEKLR